MYTFDPAPLKSTLVLQILDEKIDFAVTPDDPRYYLSYGASPQQHQPDPQSPPSPDDRRLRFLSPELQQLAQQQQHQQEYPGDLLQYQDEETRYVVVVCVFNSGIRERIKLVIS